MNKLTTQRFLAGFVALAAIQALFFYASFFVNLNSTLAEWSESGINWPLQLFYNFLHGRPFQSSLYAAPGGGVAVGFVGNPHAYIHANVIHANFLPYLFAYAWALRPTLAWLYGLIILWNVVCGLVLTGLILKSLSPRDWKPKAVFASAVFLAGGLLSILDQFAQFLLFVGPFLMAVYYFFLTRRRFWFLAAVAAVCLTGEDAAMTAVSFLAYLYFFEPEGKPYALRGAAFAVPYTLLILLVVQPASRAELTLLSGTNMTNVLKQVFELTPDGLARNVKTMWPLFTVLPAFAMAGPLFGWPPMLQAWRIAGLGLVSTAPYWGESFARGGGHHILPPFISTYLALLAMLGQGKAEGGAWARRRVPAAALAATAVFLLFSWRVQSNNLPTALKPSLYRLSGKAEKAAATELSLKIEEASNRAVIAAARALPPEKSLVYLVNYRSTGFFLDRSDVWQCADTLQGPYAFEQTDYFLVQKDGIDLTCCLNPSVGSDLREVLKKGGEHVNDRSCPMTSALLKVIRETFVQTHRVVQDDDHVLLLENRHPRTFISPATTLGFGWRRNLFKKAVIAASPSERD